MAILRRIAGWARAFKAMHKEAIEPHLAFFLRGAG